MRSSHLVVVGLSVTLLGHVPPDEGQATAETPGYGVQTHDGVTHIWSIDDVDRLLSTRPGDAVDLRRMLEDINRRTLTDMEQIVRTRYRNANMSTSELAVLTSWPAQRNMDLTVNGRRYRVALRLDADGIHYLSGLFTSSELYLAKTKSEAKTKVKADARERPESAGLVEYVVTPPVGGGFGQ